MFNVRLFGTLSTRVDIPDFALGVGVAEDLSPKPLILHYPNQVSTDPLKSTIMSITDISPKLQSDSVSKKEFPSSGWLGNPYGGI